MIVSLASLAVIFSLAAGLVLFFPGRTYGFSRGAKFALASVIIMYTFRSISNVFEWSGLSPEYVDNIEDHIEVLVPVVWFLFFYAFFRHQDIFEISESELRYRTLFESANDAIFLMKGENFIDCNAKTLEMFGCEHWNDMIGQPPYKFSPEKQPDGSFSKDKALEKINAALKGDSQFFEWRHSRLDGSIFEAEVSLSSVEMGGDLGYILAVVRDITKRKKAEEEIQNYKEHLEELVTERTVLLKKKVKELQTAMDRIKTLEGLVPTCASCKKMLPIGKDSKDSKSWIPMEEYISSRTKAEFTHGLCPDCIKKLYGDVNGGGKDSG